MLHVCSSSTKPHNQFFLYVHFHTRGAFRARRSAARPVLAQCNRTHTHAWNHTLTTLAFYISTESAMGASTCTSPSYLFTHTSHLLGASVVKHASECAQHLILVQRRLLCMPSRHRMSPCPAALILPAQLPVERGPCSRPAPARRCLMRQGQSRLPPGAVRHAGAAALPVAVWPSLHRSRLQPLPAGSMPMHHSKRALQQLQASLLLALPLALRSLSTSHRNLGWQASMWQQAGVFPGQ